MYSERTKQAALELVGSGKSYTEAANEVHVHRATVRGWWLEIHPEAKRGASINAIPRRPKNHAVSTMRKAWKMKAEGHKYEYIAAITKVSLCTLSDWFTFRTRKTANMIHARKWGLLHDNTN